MSPYERQVKDVSRRKGRGCLQIKLCVRSPEKPAQSAGKLSGSLDLVKQRGNHSKRRELVGWSHINYKHIENPVKK